ncbi:alpha-1,3-mannosyl-glycoprotein 4-beta-N-acetylglucosaminyltransferase B-like isoform X1 [Mytilus edulis]|uniref:alpha-1,3-mannosyl-glycoprotein 4-beta-N-acetylglucosaminyltransferase B-like isoform X1 n=2 Tax=Mytilus edulis TaxID=6550 RepID=UPI0039EEF705
MMRARPRSILITVGLVLCTVFWLALFSKEDRNYDHVLQVRFAELQDKLEMSDTLNRERQDNLNKLRNQFNYFLQMVSQNSTVNRSQSDYMSSELQELFRGHLHNITEENQSGTSLHLPSIFTYLPHLTGHPESLKPKYHLSKNKFGASIVIGIPTIKREKISYLSNTLKSLVNGLTAQEKRDCLIIVFIAEPYNNDYVESVGREVQTSFPKQVESGLIEVISPSEDFYPNLNDIPLTYGDTKERVKWRTKQNLDFSFLMLYARTRGIYYVQLEDDVLAKPGYFTIMKTFAEQQSQKDWILLEFSSLGFIGKMFKSSKLPIVVEFFLMFFKDKPIDWLLDYLLAVKVCNPEKDSKHCNRMKQEVRVRFKPSLFQHVGMQSSLKGKVQKLKDRDFGKHMLFRVHVNPSAELRTSLTTYLKFTVQKAYIGQDIFWALAPNQDDYIEVILKPPVALDEILFRSGKADHREDKFYNTSLQVIPLNYHDPIKNRAKKTKDGYFDLAEFDKEGIVHVRLASDVGKLSKIRIKVHKSSENWVIISEIHLKQRTPKQS